MANGRKHTPKPSVELAQLDIDPRSVHRLSYRYCLQNGVVILGRVDPEAADSITLGMLEAENLLLRDQLQALLRRPVRAVRLNAFEVRRALDLGYGRLRVPVPMSRL